MIKLLIDERSGHEAERALADILECCRLLVGQPRILAGGDLGDKAETDRIALAGGAVELIDHAADHAGDAGALRGILERKIIDRAVGGEPCSRGRSGLRRCGRHYGE
jgi:hypothetical protein